MFIFAALMLAAGVLMRVVIAGGVSGVCKRTGKISFYGFVSTARYAAEQFNASLSQSVLRTAADTAAD